MGFLNRCLQNLGFFPCGKKIGHDTLVPLMGTFSKKSDVIGIQSLFSFCLCRFLWIRPWEITISAPFGEYLLFFPTTLSKSKLMFGGPFFLECEILRQSSIQQSNVSKWRIVGRFFVRRKKPSPCATRSY